MFERILVPLDGSPSSEIVLPYVIQIASRFGSGIVLARVQGSSGRSSAETYSSYLTEITNKLQAGLKDWQADEAANVNSRVLTGNPATEILRCASYYINCHFLSDYILRSSIVLFSRR